MTNIAIRRSGGANIISLPKAVLKTLGLEIGSSLGLSLEDNKIILTPVKSSEPTLEQLLKGSPKKNFALTDEDKSWISSKAVGKELV